ncbi:hypothetical protein [Chryseobacterium sp.]|uniref:hypothetical protein n=1 Tax=Chryseobacterium sp. TaxID=1871047 RepID=UPI0033424CA8
MMKYLLILLFTGILQAQTIELTNQKMITYYRFINKAENSIVNGNLEAAHSFYKEAFAAHKEPNAKDLYNSMVVSLNIKDEKDASENYYQLKCLGYSFDGDILKNRLESLTSEHKKCSFQIDLSYKKTLDSLFTIDQHYRKLSDGNYNKYQKEITRSDSIASVNLLKLIQKKGFPNEYDLGLSSANKVFFHEFYFIIWHQLATNLYSPQKVNFSQEIGKALNNGKITPENAAFLLDLNNGRNDYSSKHFSITQFVTSNGSNIPLYEQSMQKIAHVDCCYVTYVFFPEKRTESIHKMIKEITERRTKIGLSNVDDDLQKKIFMLNNTEYKFSDAMVEGMAFEKESDLEFFKKNMYKIK